MNNTAKLPRSVQEIADVIGRDAALRLVEALPRSFAPSRPYGRAVLYVPKSIRADHELVGMIGWDLATKLARMFGGEILQPSKCFGLRSNERNNTIRAMRASGCSTQSIAREFHMSDRQVRNIVKEIPDMAANETPANNRAA